MTAVLIWSIASVAVAVIAVVKARKLVHGLTRTEERERRQRSYSECLGHLQTLRRWDGRVETRDPVDAAIGRLQAVAATPGSCLDRADHDRVSEVLHQIDMCVLSLGSFTESRALMSVGHYVAALSDSRALLDSRCTELQELALAPKR